MCNFCNMCRYFKFIQFNIYIFYFYNFEIKWFDEDDFKKWYCKTELNDLIDIKRIKHYPVKKL